MPYKTFTSETVEARRAPTPRKRRQQETVPGGNSVYLSVAQTAKGYSDNRWATYKQIKDMGGQVPCSTSNRRTA